MRPNTGQEDRRRQMNRSDSRLRRSRSGDPRRRPDVREVADDAERETQEEQDHGSAGARLPKPFAGSTSGSEASSHGPTFTSAAIGTRPSSTPHAQEAQKPPQAAKKRGSADAPIPRQPVEHAAGEEHEQDD